MTEKMAFVLIAKYSDLAGFKAGGCGGLAASYTAGLRLAAELTLSIACPWQEYNEISKNKLPYQGVFVSI